MLHLRLLQANQPDEDFVVVPVPRIACVGPFAQCKSQAEAIALLREFGSSSSITTLSKPELLLP